MKMLEKQFGGSEGLGEELDRMFEAFGSGGGEFSCFLWANIRTCVLVFADRRLPP